MALDFNTEPYFDDYNSEKDFYRILFRPSYAVQARELTQLQTILQNQVSRFGDHVFKNGSQVIPGSVIIDNNVHFIKVEQFSGTSDVTTYIHKFKNKIITGATSKVKMLVVDTSGSDVITDNLEEPTLYCKILGADSVIDDTGIAASRLRPGENLVAHPEDNTISSNYRLTEDQLEKLEVIVKATGGGGKTSTYLTEPTAEFPDPESSNVLGYAYSVTVQAGIYYIDGTFVRNDELKLYVGRFTNKPSYRVGFKVTEQAVTPEDDETILDNATGSYNFAAPGAHRYQVKLSLVKLPLLDKDSIKFVELVRVIEGRTQYKIERASYAELEKTLARRTYDESGNYEVNKFKISIREHLKTDTNQGVYSLEDGGDADKLVAVIDPGKAYINGYEVESTASQFIELNKAREIGLEEFGHISRITRQNIGLNNGYYVKANNLYNYPNVDGFEQVYLVNRLQTRPARLTAVLGAVGGVDEGKVVGVTINDAGEGYTSGSVSVSFYPLNERVEGDIDAIVTIGVANGRLNPSAITVTEKGSGYDFAPLAIAHDGITPALGSSPSTSEIVGTARIKAVETHSGDYTGSTTVYKVGLFDINMFSGKSFEGDVKSIVGIKTSGNFSCNLVPASVPLSGLGTSSTSTAVITGSSSAFEYEGILRVGDVVFLDDNLIGTVQSFDNFTITLTSNAKYSITNGRISVFRASIFGQNFSSLLFPVGQSFIKTLKGRNVTNTLDSEDESAIQIRRTLTATTDSNIVTFTSVTDPDETVEDNTDLSNYTLFDIDHNIVIDLKESMITFNTSGTRRTITVTGVPAGSYKLLATINQESARAAAKKKDLIQDYTQDITNKNILSNSTIQLHQCDVFKLKQVLMTPGSYDVFDENLAAVDITNRYTLDNGQRDSFYTNGSLVLKTGYQKPSGAVRVKYDYFEGAENSSGSYFSVDSYSDIIDYSEIPSHFVNDPVTGKRKEIKLADVIDFRPYINGNNADTHTPKLPKFGSSLLCPVAFYIGRIDKIVLDSVGKFNVLSGVPDFLPKEPADPKEAMVLATVSVQPYTKDVRDVIVKQRDNKRYTMKDIGNLEKRISNLEYYVTLSLLEKETADLQITDELTGLDRFKNGFIVDQFTGHGVGDVKNEDYKVSIDPQTRVMRPMHFTQALELVEDLASGSERTSKPYAKTGDLVTLPYDETTFIFNNNATRSMDIQALAQGAYKGTINLVPEGDNWKSIERRPDLTVVDDNNYDAIKFMAEELGVTGTKWNEWQTNWTSSTTRTSTFETKVYTGYAQQYIHTGYETTFTDYVGYNWRDGIQTDLTSVTNAQDYGDRIVDVSYIPFMRARPVTVIAQNLKANTKFYPFFDNTPVSSYLEPANKFVVTRQQSPMSFDLNDLNNNLLADTNARAYNGKIEQAFAIGDVLVNSTHQPINVESIVVANATDTYFTVQVTSNANIRAGHHVVMFNLDYHNASGDVNLNDLVENQILPSGEKIIKQTDGLLDNTVSARQLNLKVYKVRAVIGNKQLELVDLGYVAGASNNPQIGEVDPYTPSEAYDVNKSGKLYRLKASGVVVFGGKVLSVDSANSPIEQEIYVTNIKNGFAIGESLTGTVYIGSSTSVNGVQISSINGATTTLPTMASKGDALLSDSEGNVVGVFHIPESDDMSFRTGERTFKLSDNSSNSGAAFDSTGSAVYYSQGIALSKERTIVSTRTIEFVQSATYEDTQSLPPVRRTTTSTKQIYQWVEDPLAQTFTVSSDGGCFLTSIDLFFASKGDRPVSIEIRNTDNGVPSTKIVPFSNVTKPASQIQVSTDSSKATTFKFKSPLYLQDSETYALVVLCDTPGTQVYVSEMGQTDILTSNTVAGQPLTGSLYASQNAREWEIHPLLDMKFIMRKAKFDISSTGLVEFKTTPPGMINLPRDPFEITPGTDKVRVYAYNHGLNAGDIVTISGVEKGFYGTEFLDVGIPETLFNTSHTVLVHGLEKDSFVIELQTVVDATSLITYKDAGVIIEGSNANFIKGEYGGTGVKCTSGINMDMLYVKTSDLNFQETDIKYKVVAQNKSGSFTNPLAFIANNNFSFPTRMNIRSYENQSKDANGNRISSISVSAELYSSNANVSPTLDLQQISAFAISNLINNSFDSTSYAGSIREVANINVQEIDRRVLISGDNVLSGDYSAAGTGLVGIITGTDVLTGNTTEFQKKIVPGNKIYIGGNLIGVVDVINSDTELVLVDTYAGATLSSQAYTISSTPELVFENVGGAGVIRTNIDKYDNMLETASVGKTIGISNVHASVDGEYTIVDIISSSDFDTYAGNVELDKTKVVLDRAFGSGVPITLDMTQDADFEVYVFDKFVSDLAPFGSSNMANYVTRTLTLTESADSFKVIFDSNIVNNTDVKVYYRTWSGDVDLRKLAYKDTGFTTTNQDVEGKFTERSVEVFDIEPFYNISIKIVLKSSDPVFVPKIKNLRLVALS